MRQEITVRSSTDVAVFDPKETATADAKLTAVIDYAKRVKDWPLLEQAIDQKIEEQREFVQWWDDNVSVRHGGNRASAQIAALAMSEAEEATEIPHQLVSKWRKRLKDVDAYRTKLYGKAWREAFGQSAAHVSHNDGEHEWYTPPHIIEAARAVMGGIDLDPASSVTANKIVGASKFYTAKDNGLTQEWFGRVWLNPPYAQPLISHFAKAVVGKVDEYECACVLVNNATDTDWLQSILRISAATCFLHGRVKFLDKNGDPGAPLQGQVVAYIGIDIDQFVTVFNGLGWVGVNARRGG